MRSEWSLYRFDAVEIQSHATKFGIIVVVVQVGRFRNCCDAMKDGGSCA